MASDDHTFIISARVGGANQTLIIDNLVVRAGASDFDNDGLSDLAEYNSGASDPTKSDSDGDGLTDGEEVAAGTQPLVADTDGDGINDGAEELQELIHSIQTLTTTDTLMELRSRLK